MSARLKAWAASYPVVGHARGRGAMVAIELVDADGITPDKGAATRIAAACHAEGLVVLTAGTHSNVVRLLPPLVMPDHLLEEGLDILERAVAAA